MTEDKKSAKDKVSDGIKEGLGVLSAFKEALEETINEARERGDLSADRAKEVMKDALDKAQAKAGEAKEKLDFVHQKEFDGLREAVDAVKARVAALEEHFHGEAKSEDGAETDDAEEAGADAPAGDNDAEVTSEEDETKA